MRGIIGKALAGAGTGLAQASLIHLQSQALEARERRLIELRAEHEAGQKSRDLIEVGDPESPTGTRMVARGDAEGKPGPGARTGSSSRKTYGELGVVPGTNLIGQMDSDGQWHVLPGQDKNASASDKKTLQNVAAKILEKISTGEGISEHELDAIEAYYNMKDGDPVARYMLATLTGQDINNIDIRKSLEKYVKSQDAPQSDAGSGAAAPAAGGADAPRYREGQTAVNPKTGQRVIFSGGKWVPAIWTNGAWQPAN